MEPMALTDHPPALILAPLDQGVRNVSGRDGASQGPSTLLDALKRDDALPADLPIHRPPMKNQPETLEEDLDALTRTVEHVLAEDQAPIVIGGDHGTTYATMRAIAQAFEDPGVCYLDVHLDLRPYQPQHTSGSSFRRLIEERHVEPDRVRPIGIQRPDDASARATFDELASYAKQEGLSWVALEEAKRRSPKRVAKEIMQEGTWFASFDVDAMSQKHAPGVSAPGPGRFSLEDARGFLDAAVDHAVGIDIVEYAPRHDEQDTTETSLVKLVGHVLGRLSGS